jgi:hypothetical protein
LLRNGDSKSSQGPSFPHAFSGNPGETQTGPPTHSTWLRVELALYLASDKAAGITGQAINICGGQTMV